jgi:P-type E1-E2 ATPase
VATELSERPGQGLTASVDGQAIFITSRSKLLERDPAAATELPAQAIGLECVVLVDGHYAGALQFRDQPRGDSRPFLKHVGPLHNIHRILLISGDREVEVRRLADELGIHEVYGGQSPEQKLALVRAETARAQTLYVGDGINDAPALTAATVGLAFGGGSDITAEAAGAVILEGSLRKVDDFLHISRRVRSIALQSAVGGMLLSAVGMGLAAAGYLTPVAGAITQELIDVLAIANALRVSFPRQSLSDF